MRPASDGQSMASSARPVGHSSKWSCETLREGYEHVLKELEAAERQAEREIAELNAVLQATKKYEEAHPDAHYGASLETIPASPGAVERSLGRNPPQVDAMQPGTSATQPVIEVPDDSQIPKADEGPKATPVPKARPTLKIKRKQSVATLGSPSISASADAGDSKPKKPVVLTSMKKTRQVLLHKAALARIRRMVAPKKKRRDLDAPQFLKDQWKGGKDVRDNLAELLKRVNFDKDAFLKKVEISVRKDKVIEVTISEGWYSEQEMSQDLKWSAARIAGAKRVCEAAPDELVRTNMYDGVREYHVQTRESGTRSQKQTESELRSRTEEDSGAAIPDLSFGDLDKAMNRAQVPKQAVAQAEATSEYKDRFTKFMESVLQKSGKLRSQLRDLSEKFKSTAQVKSYEQEVIDDGEYDKLNEVLAHGAVDGYGKPFWSKAEPAMRAATMRCSRAAALEAKLKNAKKYFEKNDSNKRPGETVPSTGSKRPKHTAAKTKPSKKR